MSHCDNIITYVANNHFYQIDSLILNIIIDRRTGREAYKELEKTSNKETNMEDIKVGI